MATIDRRVQRTRTALRMAFRQLALKYPHYRDITVKELTATANINRKTFYLHFDSIDDLAETFVEDSAEKILAILNPQDFKANLAQPGSIFDQLLHFYHQSRDFHRVILLNDDYSFLARKVQDIVVDGLTTTIQTNYTLSKIDAQICATFLVHNIMTFFRLYFTGQLELSASELKQRLVSLNSYGIHQFFYPNEN